ncbi:restriction endonuclease subunit S [Lysobacteraceae bacterium NML120232]|nr:restriction endonuclease subunit S [Xanthomonadaceae bacterium NML120232]
MKQAPLSELAAVSAGQSAPKDSEFSDVGVPFIRAGSLDALLAGKSELELELVAPETAKLRKLKTYPRGTILFAKSGMSATKDRVYVLQRPAHVVSHLAALIPNSGVCGDYLRLALKSFPPSSLIKDPAYPAMSLGDISSFKIPVPVEPENQRRVAHLLGKAEALIAQRKQQLQQLDELLKSVFLQMFGDPVRNEKRWLKESIGAFADVETGATPSRKKQEIYYGGGIPWVKTTEVKNEDIFKTEECITGQALIETNCSLYPVGTVLLAMYGQGRTRGQVGYLKVEAATNQACAAILPSKHNQVFIFHQLKLMYGVIRSLGRGGNQENLNLSLVRGIELLLPPKNLQDNFVAIAEKIEKLKTRYQRSLAELEALYGSLSQKAFKGELDLSRIPLPAQRIEPVSIGDQASVPEPVVQTQSRIELPNSDMLPEALSNSEARKALLEEWLQAYSRQLHSSAFSAQDFMTAAQERLLELLPDAELALGVEDYECIKAWVFEALAAGTLTQAFDDAGNRITLKA